MLHRIAQNDHKVYCNEYLVYPTFENISIHYNNIDQLSDG